MTNHNDLLGKFEIITRTSAGQWYTALIEALTLPEHTNTDKNKKKSHIRYFYNYLFNDPNGLQAKLILIEYEYTSKAYLSDYMNYYANCYRDYPKRCRRVHFFSKTFDKKQFINMVTGKDALYEADWSSYLGYIVVKPLPTGIIGTTLLSTYGAKAKRHFSALRPCHINLFGKNLVLQTLPYQEQDGIVGTCASSALWFTFQKTCQLFNSLSPNPSEITISAGFDSNHTGKTFPSSGLEISQICKAVLSAGLVSELRILNMTQQTSKYLKSFVYAYLKMGIPVLLGLKLEGEWRDLHLVAVNGYRLGVPPPQKERYKDLSLASDDITRFYAHDDQVGPFARLVFMDENTEPLYQFKTSWWRDADTEDMLMAKAYCAIVPLPASIKVTFDDIEAEIANFEVTLRTHLELAATDQIRWDIYLSENNGYKKEIRDYLSGNDRPGVDPEAGGILFELLPQYIWVAKAFLRTPAADFLLFDLVYDAIDVNYKSSPYSATIYDETFKRAMIKSGIADEINIFKRYKQRSQDTELKRTPDMFEKLGVSDSLDDLAQMFE